VREERKEGKEMWKRGRVGNEECGKGMRGGNSVWKKREKEKGGEERREEHPRFL
jgi:hypothetical protein